MRHDKLLLQCLVAMGISIAGSALAQRSVADAFPSRPITLVVPFTAGGPADGEARRYIGKIQESMGQPFVFDFKPGGGTTIGVGYVAKAAPDGHTLLLHNGGFTVHPNFYPDLPYDIIRSFSPITQLSGPVTVMLVSTTALPGVHTLPDLIAFGKANPDTLNCGTAGSGGISHIVCAALASAIGQKITPVHYKGASQGQVDLIAGRTHLSAGTYFNALTHIKSGKLRPIVALGSERSKILPDMKTAIEQGFDVEFPQWSGVIAPAGTPVAIVNKLNAEIAKVVLLPDNVKDLEAQGIVAIANSPDAFRAKIAAEAARWKKIIQEKGITAD